MFRLITGIPGASGFGSASTAEEVSEGIDATNLTAIITGGASGIGFETARVLALRNAHVIIAARNLEAANEVKQTILKDSSNARVDVLELDLASLKSVKAFAHNFVSLNLPLNILINNAGVMFCPYQLSEDGIEMQFATNHLDKMKDTAKSTGIEGRIVNLASVAHLHTYSKGIAFQHINDKKRFVHRGSEYYCEFSASRVDNDKSIQIFWDFDDFLPLNQDFAAEVLKLATHILWKNVHQGAATTCYVALHPGLKGASGKYYVDCNEYKPSRFARDEDLAKRLWDFSCNSVNAAEKV
ncbi:Rossmann-fold superfamily protein [Perilla frutescens var. frutescens]|nr:Rossmann-fold superfamily protein [Perilla frutescens var. frutescens]